MFDTLKMIVYKFNEQKKETKQIFSFSSKYHLECSKCGKRSLIEPWLDYREEE